jgi:diguanylate cyclase (GGDEF)-like protein
MSTNVLIVEDSASMRAMISGVVSAIGFEPIEASSGEEALGVFVSNKVDVAVLDVNMEGINGFETCRQLRILSKSNWFPVIYLSATDSVENIVEGLDAGGDVYVTKPINPRVLEATLKALGRIADMKSALDKANRELEKLAAYDGLTQVPNRRSFDESLVRFSLQAKREKTDLALILIDIDHFKPYNDNYGHMQGDECLKQFAQGASEALLRPVDMFCRYGGEEFGVLLPNTSKEGAENVAKRIAEKIAEMNIEHAHSPTDTKVTASMGIALSVTGETDAVELLDQADQALYRAKEGGRNQYQF